VRLATVPTLLTVGATAQSGNLLFTLNSLNLDSSLQALYDSYRIDCVRVVVKPQNTAVGLVTNTSVTLVDFYNVIDYNNTVATATPGNFVKYDNCIVLPPGEGCSRTFSPRPQTMVSAISGTGYESTNPMWLNTANDDVAHYGLRYLIPAGATGQTIYQTWELHVEYWVSFKAVN
jgi:hypothetical protein